jgi:hypothetical protein
MRLACYLICAATLFSGCGNPRQPSEPAKFDFHSGAGGYVIWRCNRQTGEVYFCDYRRRSKLNPNARAPQWRKVLEPAEIETPPVADEPSLGADLNLSPASDVQRTDVRQPQTVETPYGAIEFPADMPAAKVRAETERFVRAHSPGGPLESSNTTPPSPPPRQVPR